LNNASACETGSDNSFYVGNQNLVSVPSGNAYLDFFDGLSLEAHAEKYRRLHSRQAKVIPEPFIKVERGDVRYEVEDDVVVDHVVSVRIEAFEIKRRHEERKFGRGNNYITGE